MGLDNYPRSYPCKTRGTAIMVDDKIDCEETIKAHGCPWQDALEALTGSREMDATAIVDYFAPVKKYMDDELAKKGVKSGW